MKAVSLKLRKKMAYNLKQWSVGKLATSSYHSVMAVCSWLIAIRVFFTNENANANYSEIVNNTDKEIEEIIIESFGILIVHEQRIAFLSH